MKNKYTPMVDSGIGIDLPDGRSILSTAIGADPELRTVIVCAVNRDYLFEAMVAALTPFKSTEMGQLLIDALFVRGEPEVAAKAKERFVKLINAVDVVLKGVELAKEREPT
jgi:hypothetical protein